MNALPIREKIIAHLDNLSEEQVTKVLTFIETIETSTYDPQTDPMLNGELLFNGSPDLSEENDPLIGFFSSSPDLGE